MQGRSQRRGPSRRNSLVFASLFWAVCFTVLGCVTDPVGLRCAGDRNRLDAEKWSGMKLWYRQPARQWTEALPVGNGQLGAMVFGGTEHERLQFNEDTLWTGQPHEYQHDGAVEYLPSVRQLLFEGKQRQAEELAMEKMMSVPLRQEKYQPFGDLHSDFPGHGDINDYRRELDIDSGISTVRYRIGEATFTREVLCQFSGPGDRCPSDLQTNGDN